MAKLCSYYRLCPLIDTKSLLGISNDVEKGMVIVTLGKNMAIKYRLSDQKQICSWRTKEKFSSLILYSKKLSKYVAIFNQSYIKMWGDDENLDRLKKYKCNNTQIHTIIPHEEDIYVLFRNGALYTLDDVLQHRKTLDIESVINEDNEIQDVLQICVKGQLYVGFLVRIESCYMLYWTDCKHGPSKFSKIKLERTDCFLSGYVFHQGENSVQLLTVWSDGRIYSCLLQDTEVVGPGELFTILDNVSSEQTVSMASLDENYIAIYGADSNEEGATLLIYNTQFKVTPSKQIHKLFTEDSKLWRVDNNLFLPTGQNLVVVPFSLESEQLAALVGSHKVIQESVDPDVSIVQDYKVANWLKKEGRIKKTVEDSKVPFSNFLCQGLPESQVVEQVLPEILEKQDLDRLKMILGFKDIPEKCLVKILKFVLSSDVEEFKNKNTHDPELVPPELQSVTRTELLDDVLRRPFSDVLLLPYIHSELTINDVLLLMKYICFMLSENGHLFRKLSVVKTEEKLINWSCLLIDASYQKLLLSKDEKILDVLNDLYTVIKEEVAMLEKIEEAVPSVLRVKSGKVVDENKRLMDLKYSVEQLCLY